MSVYFDSGQLNYLAKMLIGHQPKEHKGDGNR